MRWRRWKDKQESEKSSLAPPHGTHTHTHSAVPPSPASSSHDISSPGPCHLPLPPPVPAAPRKLPLHATHLASVVSSSLRRFKSDI